MEIAKIVQDGYDVMADSYHASRVAREAVNIEWLDGLRPQFPSSGRVLDLGCGSGVPITRYFASRGYDVTGYDLSSSMLDIARREVPTATFVHSSIEEIDITPGSVDLIVSFFAVIHIPRHRHAELFCRMSGWLCPGGAILLSLGAGDNPAERANFHGAPMAWSHFDADTNLALLRAAGFEITWSEVEHFPGESHLFVLAKNA